MDRCKLCAVSSSHIAIAIRESAGMRSYEDDSVTTAGFSDPTDLPPNRVLHLPVLMPSPSFAGGAVQALLVDCQFGGVRPLGVLFHLDSDKTPIVDLMYMKGNLVAASAKEGELVAMVWMLPSLLRASVVTHRQHPPFFSCLSGDWRRAGADNASVHFGQ